ncbi:hypothetical protein ACIGHN_27555 [Acidovorax sp. NPDC077693]|uniref:hypothetical protein n=1 Tax=unclassified Acidovorax TaxID=2684926 RepID=UPI0037C86FC0
MKTLTKTIYLIALSAILSAPSIALAARSYYTCPSRYATCYVSLFYTNGGVRNFTIHGGTGDWLGGLQAGDRYCHNFTGPNDPRTCTRMMIPLQN